MAKPSERDRELAREMHKQFFRPQGWDDTSLLRCYSHFLAAAREEGRAEEREAREDAERGFRAVEQECREANRRLREATQWRPIDDEARNGQRWLLRLASSGAAEARYDSNWKIWITPSGMQIPDIPELVTNYAPLPEPPR